MQQKYLTPDDPDAFLDYTVMARADYQANYSLCPRCKGHGGWNLKINQYRLPPGVEDTSENRSRYVHFRCSCSHCSGWGYVHPSITCTGHEWVFEKNLGRCYNRYRCSVCNGISDVDSSD